MSKAQFANIVKASCRLPVEDVSNTGDNGFRGTWIADATFAPREHNAIFRAPKMVQLTTQIRRARANVQKKQDAVAAAKAATVTVGDAVAAGGTGAAGAKHRTNEWKVEKKLIKDDFDVKNVKGILRDNFFLLKEIFIYLACKSQYPGIT